MPLTAEVVVVGAGVIGLCTATALARLGIKVTLVGERRSGEASPAAAGMLAPSVERAFGPAHDFAIAARDFYPAWLDELASATGVQVPLNRRGVLQIAVTENGIKGLRKSALPNTVWLTRDELVRLEPWFSHALGAVFSPDDGAVDNVSLLRALEVFVAGSSYVKRISGRAVSLQPHSSGSRVTIEAGETVDARVVVLAPGAWGAELAGAPCLRSVIPVRGQLVAYQAIELGHVVYGPRGYLVPRENAVTIAGSTMEHVGFDAGTTIEGIARVRSAAEEIAPLLATAPVASTWAGLRPVTPDMLPLLGPAANDPSLIYACGHSRNGILLAPLTGEVVSSIVAGTPLKYDLSQFRPDRF